MLVGAMGRGASQAVAHGLFARFRGCVRRFSGERTPAHAALELPQPRGSPSFRCHALQQRVREFLLYGFWSSRLTGICIRGAQGLQTAGNVQGDKPAFNGGAAANEMLVKRSPESAIIGRRN